MTIGPRSRRDGEESGFRAARPPRTAEDARREHSPILTHTHRSPEDSESADQIAMLHTRPAGPSYRSAMPRAKPPQATEYYYDFLVSSSRADSTNSPRQDARRLRERYTRTNFRCRPLVVVPLSRGASGRVPRPRPLRAARKACRTVVVPEYGTTTKSTPTCGNNRPPAVVGPTRPRLRGRLRNASRYPSPPPGRLRRRKRIRTSRLLRPTRLARQREPAPGQ